MDSSAIAALVAKFYKTPVHTFSIHFGSECPNELEFSSLVASHCQTQHYILEITLNPEALYLNDYKTAETLRTQREKEKE
ncbi:asparagine synthase-related protein [Nostoc sp.]|uniref:asparagine synthase-related protein n=1 Tax=Nostoc sp. TaxID=1180 RepID=UPI003FA5A6EE